MSEKIYPGLFVGKGRLAAYCFDLQSFQLWQSLSLSSSGSTYQRDLRTSDLRDLPQFQTIIFACAPADRSEEAYIDVYHTALRNVLENCSYERIIYCGSTGVYSENSGGIVTELSPVSRHSFRSRVLLEAEDLVQRYAPKNHVILRLTGLCETLDVPGYGVGKNHWCNRLTRSCAAKWLEKAVMHSGLVSKTVNINEYTGCDQDSGGPYTGKRIVNLLSETIFGEND